MVTRWMTAGMVLAISAVGCSTETEPPPSEPSSVPKEVSETDEAPKSPFKQVETRAIDDMQPAVVAGNGFKRIEPQPVQVTTPAPVNRAPEPSVSTTRPVEPPAQPRTEDDEESTDEDNERKRRRRQSGSPGGSGVAVASPFGFGGGFAGGSSGGGFAGGFGDEAISLPAFGSDSFTEAEDFGSDYTGSGLSQYESGISLSDNPDDFDVVGDDLAQTTDDLGPPPRSDDPAGGPAGGHGGPTDGGLSPAPPVPPPDF